MNGLLNHMLDSAVGNIEAAFSRAYWHGFLAGLCAGLAVCAILLAIQAWKNRRWHPPKYKNVLIPKSARRGMGGKA